MNGARTTYMRRGYLLTALAAAALLAVSPGTAEAQNTGVTITGPSNNTVNEGGTATYTVNVRGYIAVAASAGSPTPAATATVTLGVPAPDTTDAATAGEPTDVSQNEGNAVTFNIPANASTTVAQLFNQTKTIRLATTQDADAEDEKFTLTFTPTFGSLKVGTAADAADITAAATNPTSLTIKDDETQTYVLALSPATQRPQEGTPVTVSLMAVPAHEDGSKQLTLNLDKPAPAWSLTVEGTAGNTATLDSATATDATPGQAIQIINPPDDKNRVSDTVTLTAHSGRAGASKLEDSLTVTLADNNALPAVTAKVVDKDGKVLDPQPTSVEEGKTVKIAVMPLDKDAKVTTANEDLEISLMPSGSADVRDYRALAKITITSGQNSSNVVDLMAEVDEDVGMETLVFDATVSGEKAKGTETSTSEGVLMLDIVDATERKIWAKAESEAYPKIQAAMKDGGGEEGLNPGESFMVMTDDLFGVMDGYTASYGVSIEGGAVSASASGDSVTVMAEEAGEAKVTVTGTARASSSFQSEQTVSNVASITFPVMVTDMKLVVMLEAPDSVMDGNIVEGNSYDIMVSANRAVHEDTEVMIMRDRAMSDADDDDFTVENATIMAGEMMATATLMVTEDMMDDSGHAAGEVLVLYGEVNGEETNSLMFTIWDTAVPALPLVAQLVLALFLALGGARLYRRRQG